MAIKKFKPSLKQKVYQAFKIFFVWANKADEIDKYFRVEKFSRLLHPMHFSQKGVDQQAKYEFFKTHLLGVELETHAYCNRTCSFCPNSFLDRRNKSQLMPESLFLKIMDELSAINFSGSLKMQRYNEPLANDIIYTRVKQARERLADANISFHSNGDYVTLEKLKKLEKAGLDEVFVSLYPDYEKKDELSQAGDQLCKAFLKRVGVTAQPVESKVSLGRYKFSVGRMQVTVFAFNLYENGNDRGGSLADVPKDTRTSPCVSPFTHLYIDWTGDVFPCCNLRADFPGHQDYILANIHQANLIDAYYSKVGNFMRKHLAGVSEKTGACKSCKFDLMCSNKHAKKLLDATLSKIAV